MTDPIPLDEQQENRHNARVIAANIRTMRDALQETFPADSELVTQLLVEWWRVMLVASNQPDFASIMGQMFSRPDDED